MFFSLLVGQPLTRVFTPLGVVAVAAATFIAAYIALDGRTSGSEGIQLVSVT